jgi:hypothetical protein
MRYIHFYNTITVVNLGAEKTGPKIWIENVSELHPTNSY